MRVRTRRGQRGLSLVEVTIMLLVLMLLTSVLAPSIFDFVNDAQWVKVKEDCEALAVSVTRLIRDVGPRLVYNNPQSSYPVNKMDLLVTDGNGATINTTLAPAIAGFPGGLTNWWNGAPALPTNFIGTCDEQLITNIRSGTVTPPIYAEAGLQFGPLFGQGWRGAYLSPPCGPDPWGFAYQVNTKFLTTIFNNAGTTEVKIHCLDVFCLSPGKDGIIETPFGTDFADLAVDGQGLKRGGDDWVTVISPCDP
ncbi:MAG: hypothetical protein AB1806_16310 [Acidobacteriota bacterium]